MADSASQNGDASTPKLGAPKDKNCPYCGQAFTSSSLGRHLDLYIKEKNPKPPDGIHDVDAIRKARGGITRRQPRGSLGAPGRSTPTGTPKPAGRREASIHEGEGFRSSAIPKDGQYAVDSTLSKFPFAPRWEATGVMNDIPSKNSWEGDAATDSARRPSMQRSVSRQVTHKAQFDVKQKLADAMDTARAAELALRELLSSWRAAKQQFDNNSMPFDFDPLSLDFPALTLQCLKPPPTLFSSTQHPTPTSWSVQSPGQREYSALQSYFDEEFRVWKIACVTATTSAVEEITYPPNDGPYRDVRETVRKAEKTAEDLEKQVSEHLESAYTVWSSLPAPRRDELWVLELARGVGRKHTETEKLKDQQHKLSQENVHLKQQIDQLNRLQQPREFKMLSPTMVPLERDLVRYAYEQGVRGGKSIGFRIDDRHADLGTVVTKSIERWKDVITSTRVSSTGMGAQRSLDEAREPQERVNSNGSSQSQTPSHAQTPQPQRPVPKRLSTTSTTGQASEHTATSTTTTAPPSIEEMSDQDADAEMEDDDSFAIMNPSPTKPPSQPPLQQQATLDVPRVRAPLQQQAQQQQRGGYLLPNGAGSPVGRAAINLSRSMPNMNMALQGNSMHGAEMGMAMQGVRGDSMYMD